MGERRQQERQPGRTVGGRGHLIAAARRSKGWTQEDLAATSGVSLDTIKRVEKNIPAFLSTLKDLCKALEIDLAALLRGPPDCSERAPADPKLLCAVVVISLPDPSTETTATSSSASHDDWSRLWNIVRAVINSLRELLGITDSKSQSSILEPFDIKTGSINVSVVLDSDSLYRVCRLLVEDKLHNLGIIAVEISRSLRETIETRVTELLKESQRLGRHVTIPDSFQERLEIIRQPEVLLMGRLQKQQDQSLQDGQQQNQMVASQEQQRVIDFSDYFPNDLPDENDIQLYEFETASELR
jgi:transcriptional regulator with XRE-family HTH domain